jgi:hypothetical protein
VPRCVIGRDVGLVGEGEMAQVAVRAQAARIERFPDMCWQHSRVCRDDGGASESLCVKSAPSAARLREHVWRWVV